MAFTRPTLQAIIDRIQGDLKSELGLSTILRRSFLDILSRALGGASHTLHGNIDFAQNQLFPDSADDEFLLRWAAIFGIARNPATFANLNITITGVASTVVPIGTIFQRTDGVQYQTDAEVIIGGGGSIAATVTALVAGADGNIADGSQISLVTPIAGVDSNATVDSTVTEGDDEETIENLRTRLIERIQQPPAGGTVTDYIAFAKTVTGVTRVWVLPNFLGQGTVGLTFVEDNESPIIPDGAKVQEVQDAVTELKPVTADLITFAPNGFSLAPTIQLKPNTTAVQNAVTAELEDLIAREAQVRDAVDPLQVAGGVQYTGKIKLSQINEAISIAAGETDHVLVTPTADVQPDPGGLVTLGTITFQTLV